MTEKREKRSGKLSEQLTQLEKGAEHHWNRNFLKLGRKKLNSARRL